MKKHTQYFILIGIVSLALGVGVGFLIKNGMNNTLQEEYSSTDNLENYPEIPD